MVDETNKDGVENEKKGNFYSRLKNFFKKKKKEKAQNEEKGSNAVPAAMTIKAKDYKPVKVSEEELKKIVEKAVIDEDVILKAMASDKNKDVSENEKRKKDLDTLKQRLAEYSQKSSLGAPEFMAIKVKDYSPVRVSKEELKKIVEKAVVDEDELLQAMVSDKNKEYVVDEKGKKQSDMLKQHLAEYSQKSSSGAPEFMAIKVKDYSPVKVSKEELKKIIEKAVINEDEILQAMASYNKEEQKKSEPKSNELDSKDEQLALLRKEFKQAPSYANNDEYMMGIRSGKFAATVERLNEAFEPSSEVKQIYKKGVDLLIGETARKNLHKTIDENIEKGNLKLSKGHCVEELAFNMVLNYRKDPNAAINDVYTKIMKGEKLSDKENGDICLSMANAGCLGDKIGKKGENTSSNKLVYSAFFESKLNK